MKRTQPTKIMYTVGRTLSTGVAPVPTPKSETHSDDRPKPARKSVRRRLIILLLLLTITLPLIVIAWDAYNYAAASQKLFGTSNLLDGLSQAPVKGSSRSRTNIMVVGFSADDPGHAGANLTDSILLISLSTTSPTGYMLSIPRDLYVPIPEYGRAKINEAYQDGETGNFNESGYPAGGIGLLEKTIYESLGITTDYYALVDYSAVREATDAVGGITVHIKSTDPRGIYDPNFKSQEGGPLKLPNGEQKIDGLTALRLSRARGAAGGSYGLVQSDFDRTKNQQAVVAGLKNAVNWNILLNPTKNKKLLEAIADNVKTDISISEALPLYKIFRAVPESQLRSLTLRDLNGVNLLRDYATPYGQSALIPATGLNEYDVIRAAINNLNDL